ncbi:MOSC domain-containing protein [Duganella sp. FT27W]|uniref:MOSC domain-containing protein n=1 Tax=Duganella sp. FT27W TaxID=2654636 RepID=UPI00128D621C|nr:MOSC N-terminal beta barrel domain-containing protein [Duganella sp. FT27W]MPQ58605.1 MOSC domain-containing protein [Duganella sp. FT27W]
MPILSELILYPIKSCAGLSLPQALLTTAGLATADEKVLDREWMVVDANGGYMTQRDFPRMALITPTLHADTLTLAFPGMPALELALARPDAQSAPTRRVHIWDDSLRAYDCDDAIATWFSAALGVPCRLVRFHADAVRVVSQKWTGDVAATTLFSDGFPILVIGQGSLDDLNDKLRGAGRAALPMNRFRPNVVIAGIEAFEEDYIETFQIGDVELKPVKPCPRCPMPSVDQTTGEFGPDPLEILQSYRAKPELDGALCFGMNAIVTVGDGRIVRVGQEIEVALAF